MGNKIWEPSKKRKESSQMFSYLKTQKKTNYEQLHQWSVNEPAEFWSSLLDYFPVVYEGFPDPAYTELSFFNHPWFPEVKLNFAENLLRHRTREATALVSVEESGKRREWSYKELSSQTLKLESYLSSFFTEGDVLAAYMPNIPETVAAMLGCSSLGGVFTSTSCDFGVSGVVDRFGQSEPKVLVAATSYRYNQKTFFLMDQIEQIVSQVPSIEKIILVDFLGEGYERPKSDRFIDWKDLQPEGKHKFIKRKFNDPLYIMYSSGTTGKPKCIVHTVGGTLLQHIKELGLHTDFNQEKTLFYFTTCGWMMWNWLVSGLFFGGKIVLYEGSPGFPSLKGFLNIIEREKITIFGTSPKFLKALENSGEIKQTLNYPNLQTLMSTGAPLLPEQFDFIYEKIKADVQVASICGGTDIIGCFMLGNPLLSVHRGEIQCLGLGMDVSSFNEKGDEVLEQEGELVCRTPFVSQPLGFLQDDDNKRFKAAYFEKFPGIWHHGDFITLTQRKTVMVFGRSDATLNPGGVRIGTAELYRQTEKLDYIEDSLCVGKEKQGDVEVWLYIKLREGEELTGERKKAIKEVIRNNTTPRHVPKQIFSVKGIPYTRSGKKMELAVTRLINGKELTNIEAVANPECLSEYSS